MEESEVETLRLIKSLGYSICLTVNRQRGLTLCSEDLVRDYGDFADVFIVRKNIGLDLAAHRDAKRVLASAGITSKVHIYMNNSVYWFPSKIHSYFIDLERQSSDICAATISEQYSTHIQTYLFASFTEQAEEAIAFWLEKVKNWRLKKCVVNLGELKTSRFFEGGLRISTLPTVSQKFLRSRNGDSVNPSVAFAVELYQSGFPGVKRSALAGQSPEAIATKSYFLAEGLL